MGKRSWASPHMNSSGPSLRSSNQSHAIVIISGSRSISVTSFGRASRVSRCTWVPPPSPTKSAVPPRSGAASASACHQYSFRMYDQSPLSGKIERISPATINRRSLR